MPEPAHLEAPRSEPSLVEALGFPPDASLLIVTSDELGVTHAGNSGVYESLRRGRAASAGLVVPGPWARAAAASYRGEDVGVHLTLNAEYDLYRWGPITYCPSLLDGDGGFPRTLADLWDHADTDEVRRECRAQIERAIYWGFDVSHLSAHLGALELRPEFFDVALELAVEFNLPLRLPSADAEIRVGFPFRSLAAAEGIVSPDFLVRVPRSQGARRALDRLLSDPSAGVTEVVLRPAIDTDELRAVAPDWSARVDDHALALDATWLRDLVERAGVHLIGYRALRDLQHSRRMTD
ncbi:MAG: ChbG/HpnK family deacetylase [Acidimicrobiaceae bacterium]|nr:ChbG/HpnK family deacetylase [Acidimicrobiaceae bacterium]